MIVSEKLIINLIKESIANRFDPNQESLDQITVGDIPCQVQIVQDEESRKKGLMFRQNLPKNEGMLFIHENPNMCSYYMKNTYVPLTIAFADEKGIIFQIEDMSPGDLNNTKSIQPALYALEMNQGWFDDNEIAIGDEIIF